MKNLLGPPLSPCFTLLVPSFLRQWRRGRPMIFLILHFLPPMVLNRCIQGGKLMMPQMFIVHGQHLCPVLCPKPLDSPMGNCKTAPVICLQGKVSQAENGKISKWFPNLKSTGRTGTLGWFSGTKAGPRTWRSPCHEKFQVVSSQQLNNGPPPSLQRL